MSELKYPASSLKDLEVFEEMVALLESQNTAADFVGLSEGLSAHTEYMVFGMQLQLMADPLGIYLGRDLLKLKCTELLHRMLALRLKLPPLDADQMWSFLLYNLQEELEVLFIYYCSLDLRDQLFAN